MATDAQAGSPLWWVEKLAPKLTTQAVDAARHEVYYDGRHPVPVALTTGKYREAFVQMLREVQDNWMPIVVDAVEERLNVDGFRMPDDPAGDAAAAAIWQANHLDAESELAHTTALTTGRAAAMVWAGADGTPQITIEHPSQVLIAYESGSSRTRVAALKRWTDEWTGEQVANLYLPDGIWKFRSDNDGRTWTARGDMVANPLGVVPIVEFRNRRKLLSAARSELADVESTQDQINLLVLDMLIAAEFGAFRQRWATGIELPTDPDTGEQVDTFAASIDRLWHTANEGAKFGDFPATDLGTYIAAIENRIQSLAARTRTPPHYLLGSSGTFPSGESLKATETGLVAKISRRQVHFGEAWEEVIRLAFAVIGDPRSTATAMETIWRDAESRSESEHIDAIVKKRTLQVPLQQLWEDAGYTPPQISRFRQMLLDEALLASLNQPLVYPADAGQIANQPVDAAATP